MLSCCFYRSAIDISLLGMVNFYHRFLPGIAASLSALHSLVAAAKTAKAKLVWDDAAVSSYEQSKKKLFSPVLLAHPRPGMKLTLTTDPSDIAIGAVRQTFINMFSYDL